MADSAREICERFGYPDALEAVLEGLRGLALEFHPNLRSLLLTGSLATGDFVFACEPKGPRLLSDIDAFLFVDGPGTPSEAFRTGVAELEREHASPLFHVDVSLAPASRLRALPRTYQMVETGMTGLVLAGQDVRPDFPRSFDPRAAIGSCLSNLSKGWLYWAPPGGEWDPIYTLVLARLILDVPLLAFARRGECVPGHRHRARAFLELPDAEPLLCPETRAAVELAARVRSGDTISRRELEIHLLAALDRVLDALDGAGPFPRNPDAALVRRLAHLLPRRTPRRMGGEVRALLAARTGPLRDLAWLLRRKEAAGAAAVLGLLPWVFEGARGRPPQGVQRRLAEFTNEAPPGAEGVHFVTDGRRQYVTAACRLSPSLREKERFYTALLDTVEAASDGSGCLPTSPERPLASMSIRPLRVAIDALGAPTGGGMTIARNLVMEMAQQRPGHHFLLYHSIPELGRGPYPSNVETFAYPACRSIVRRWPWQQLRLPGILRRDAVDVLLCLSGFTSFCAGVPQVAMWQNANAASRLEIRRRWTLDAYIWAQRQLQGLSMRKAAMNVFMTHEFVRLASQCWRMERIPHRVIYHGIDRPLIGRNQAERDSIEVKALSIGHIYYHKNYENLIDAIDIYRRRYPEPISLTVVGGPSDEAYDQQLRRRIANKGLPGVVEMVGAASPNAVAHHLESASIYVTTSLLESFGLTTLEAMASGVPVVASDATCFPEVCGDAAIYCNPVDPEDIARALHRVATDAGLRRRLREGGHARVELFGWERCAREYLAALEEAAVGIDGRKRSRDSSSFAATSRSTRRTRA